MEEQLSNLVFPDDRDDLVVQFFLRQMPRVGELVAFEANSPGWTVAEVTWRLFKEDGRRHVAKPVIFLEEGGRKPLPDPSLTTRVEALIGRWEAEAELLSSASMRAAAAELRDVVDGVAPR